MLDYAIMCYNAKDKHTDLHCDLHCYFCIMLGAIDMIYSIGSCTNNTAENPSLSD